MVRTRRASKGASTPPTKASRRSHDTQASGAAAGVAFTSPEDKELVERFRQEFLLKERTFRDRIATFWAQVEVHSGAYMFDVREHVIFYTLFALIVYLVGKSLLALVL
jgi:hypothetical protein